MISSAPVVSNKHVYKVTTKSNPSRLFSRAHGPTYWFARSTPRARRRARRWEYLSAGGSARPAGKARGQPAPGAPSPRGGALGSRRGARTALPSSQPSVGLPSRKASASSPQAPIPLISGQTLSFHRFKSWFVSLLQRYPTSAVLPCLSLISPPRCGYFWHR